MNYDELIVANGKKKEDLLRELQEKLYQLTEVEMPVEREAEDWARALSVDAYRRMEEAKKKHSEAELVVRDVMGRVWAMEKKVRSVEDHIIGLLLWEKRRNAIAEQCKRDATDPR